MVVVKVLIVGVGLLDYQQSGDKGHVVARSEQTFAALSSSRDSMCVFSSVVSTVMIALSCLHTRLSISPEKSSYVSETGFHSRCHISLI